MSCSHRFSFKSDGLLSISKLNESIALLTAQRGRI